VRQHDDAAALQRRRCLRDQSIVFINILGNERITSARYAKGLQGRLDLSLRRQVVEFFFHGGDGRSESCEHADPAADIEGRIEHGFIRLQDWNRQFSRRRFDRRTERRTGIEDAIYA